MTDPYKLIMSLPLFWKIISIFLMIFSNILYLFRKQLMSLIRIILKKKNLDLLTHKLFTEKTYFKHRINLINVGDKDKNKIFKDILNIKYKSILTFADELIRTPDMRKLSNTQFYALIIKNMISIVSDYNDKMKLEFGEDIYELVMNHPEKGFNIVHDSAVRFIKGNLEEAFTSSHVVFKTPNDKIDFLFDMYYNAMKFALEDVDKIYKKFNGDLDKLIKARKKI